MDYIVSIVIFIAIYAIAALSLHLLMIQGGVFSVAHAAFLGVGAYATAIITHYSGSLWIVALIIGMGGALLLGAIFARFTLRISGDYMVVASFALLVVCTQVEINWVTVTGGGVGMPAIPRPGFSANPLLQSNLLFCIFAIGCAFVTYVVTLRIVKSPLGLVLRAMRDDEVALAAIGKSVLRAKIVIFAISSALAALAGSLYAHYMSYISPLDFQINLTITILTIVVIAGERTLWYVPLAALFVIGVTELARGIEGASEIGPSIQQVIYGLLLVAATLFVPLRKRLKEKMRSIRNN